MVKLKLEADKRGLLKNKEFQGFALFNHGQPGTERPGNFGPLYVFNDDKLFPESGLGMHPHSNVEIVTIMLSGEESHKDTLGIHENYSKGDIQLISAGSGIRHSGGNTSSTEDARHLQIWIEPKDFDTQPYVKVLKSSEKHSSGPAKLIVSPNGSQGSLEINQDIWITEFELPNNDSVNLSVRKAGYGLLIYVIDGTATIDNEPLVGGDSLFLTEWERLSILAGEASASLLLIETVL